MTKKRRYKRYSPEFKREALKRAAAEGVTDALVAEELGINPRQLRRWRDELRLLGDEAFPGQGRSRDEELTKLKREVAKLKQERDFLKDAAVFETCSQCGGAVRIIASIEDPAVINTILAYLDQKAAAGAGLVPQSRAPPQPERIGKITA